jgi:hypothetical protein
MSSKFCPTCVSSRKKKKRSRSQESIDDGGFYAPASVPRRKTASVSDNDDDSNDDFQQPFEVPQIFRPIRVDSPALDSVRPRPKPNIKTRFDTEGKAKGGPTDSKMSSSQPDNSSIPPSPLDVGVGRSDEAQQDDGNKDPFLKEQSNSSNTDAGRAQKPTSSDYSIREGEEEVEEECASSISSRSLSSLLNQLPEDGDEASRPLLSSHSHLDLEDEEAVVVGLPSDDVTKMKTKPSLVDEEEMLESDLTPRASPAPPQIVYSPSPSPPPPPLPTCPPPASSESEYGSGTSGCSRSTSRSLSRTREPVLHRSFQSRMDSGEEGLGGCSLSLVDMSVIRYADSVSSYCSGSSTREPSRSRSISLGREIPPNNNNSFHHTKPVLSSRLASTINNYSSSGNNNRPICSSRGNFADAATSTDLDYDNCTSADMHGAFSPDTASIGIGTDGIYEERSRSATPTQECPFTHSWSGETLEESNISVSKTSSVRITLKNPCGGGGSSSAEAISSPTRNLPRDDDIIPECSQSYPSLSRKSTSTSSQNANAYGNDSKVKDGDEDIFPSYDFHNSESSSGIITGTTGTERTISCDPTPTTSGQELLGDVMEEGLFETNEMTLNEEDLGNNTDDDLELAQHRNKHTQNSNKWLYQLSNRSFKCNSKAHPALLETGICREQDDDDDDDTEALKPLISSNINQSNSSWTSLFMHTSAENEYEEVRVPPEEVQTDREKYSPESSPSPNLSQVSYESLIKSGVVSGLDPIRADVSGDQGQFVLKISVDPKHGFYFQLVCLVWQFSYIVIINT